MRGASGVYKKQSTEPRDSFRCIRPPRAFRMYGRTSSFSKYVAPLLRLRRFFVETATKNTRVQNYVRPALNHWPESGVVRHRTRRENALCQNWRKNGMEFVVSYPFYYDPWLTLLLLQLLKLGIQTHKFFLIQFRSFYSIEYFCFRSTDGRRNVLVLVFISDGYQNFSSG